MQFEVNEFSSSEEEDNIRYNISNWYNTEIGKWCEEHVIGGIKLDTYMDPMAYLKVVLYGKLDSIDEMFYKLKWSK